MNGYFNHHNQSYKNTLYFHKTAKKRKSLSFKEEEDGDSSISMAIENRINLLLNKKRKEIHKEIERDKGNGVNRNNKENDTKEHYKNKSVANISSSYYSNNIKKIQTHITNTKNDDSKKAVKKISTPLFMTKQRHIIAQRRCSVTNYYSPQKKSNLNQRSFEENKRGLSSNGACRSSNYMFDTNKRTTKGNSNRNCKNMKRNVISMEHFNTVTINTSINHKNINKKTKDKSYHSPTIRKRLSNKILSPVSVNEKKELISVTKMKIKPSICCFRQHSIGKKVIKLIKPVTYPLSDANIDTITLQTTHTNTHKTTNTNTNVDCNGYISVMLKKKIASNLSRDSRNKEKSNIIVFKKVNNDKDHMNNNDEESASVLKDNNYDAVKSISKQKPTLKQYKNKTEMITKINIDPISMKKTSLINITSNLNLNSNLNSNRSNPNHKKISSIASFTKTGFIGLGIYKDNQDSFFIQKPQDPLVSSLYCFGICDGHGSNGHLVSSYITSNLPQLILSELTNQGLALSMSNSSSIKQILEEKFLSLNSSLCNTSEIETEYSGSTCNTVLINQEMITCANVGDSRAILGKINYNGVWIYDILSKDHKPNNPDESSRILRMGGRIEQYREEDGSFHGPMRVWLKNKAVPGLAMSRSMGDTVAASAGVISEPEIKNVMLREDDKFIIMGSDGVFDFMSNKECVEIVGKWYNKKDANSAVKQLYKEAHKRWRKNETIIDDITIIVAFLE